MAPFETKRIDKFILKALFLFLSFILSAKAFFDLLFNRIVYVLSKLLSSWKLLYLHHFRLLLYRVVIGNIWFLITYYCVALLSFMFSVEIMSIDGIQSFAETIVVILIGWILSHYLHFYVFLSCIFSVTEANIGYFVSPIFFYVIFMLKFLFYLLIIALIEVIMQNFTQNFLLFTLVLAHLQYFVIHLRLLSIW
jgi:hypothetical protein